MFKPVPLFLGILDTLEKRADQVAKREAQYRSENVQGLILGRMRSGLQYGVLSYADIDEIIGTVKDDQFSELARSEILLLNNGRWIFRSEIVDEGECKCDREACVGHDHKLHCYFTPYEPEWVVKTGLYQACYDEVITCPRCNQQHVRGHIGSDRTCGKPFRDQVEQTD